MLTRRALGQAGRFAALWAEAEDEWTQREAQARIEQVQAAAPATAPTKKARTRRTPEASTKQQAQAAA